jgi:hypothetical protein
VVRANDDTGLWTVERKTANRRIGVDADDVLVYNFGSTPILTRSYQSSMWLAEYCHAKGPPAGFRWIKVIPENIDAAIAFAKKRSHDEALACRNAPAENRLH